MAIATLQGPPTPIDPLVEGERTRATCHICSEFGGKVCGFLQAIWKAAEREGRLGDDCAPFFPTEAVKTSAQPSRSRRRSERPGNARILRENVPGSELPVASTP